jgi:hypothetical protein
VSSHDFEGRFNGLERGHRARASEINDKGVLGDLMSREMKKKGESREE